MTLPIVIYVQNEKILLFQAAGLIEYWDSNMVNKNFLNIKSLTVLQQLNLKHLFGTFQIWFSGCAVGGFAFIFELLIRRKFSPFTK